MIKQNVVTKSSVHCVQKNISHDTAQSHPAGELRGSHRANAAEYPTPTPAQRHLFYRGFLMKNSNEKWVLC